MCSDGFSLTHSWVKKKRQKRPLGTGRCSGLENRLSCLGFVLAVVRGVLTWKGILVVSG